MSAKSEIAAINVTNLDLGRKYAIVSGKIAMSNAMNCRLVHKEETGRGIPWCSVQGFVLVLASETSTPEARPLLP